MLPSSRSGSPAPTTFSSSSTTRGSTRLIEPYALRCSKAGNLLVYAIKAQTGEVRAYRVDRIEGVRITNTAFRPRYAVELSVALPVSTGLRR